ncbi:hypothetical protein EIP91_003321 [Steccherinum ochraceum]|uniref:RING-type domain-containing protein n=1 Tax=Steccherinum ochraceum TaxID=92696 RepID=A0A4R0RCD8_9APHY|nr:hypothetical protein EIP91_003321 [Steccherinum ochraceum]
MPTCVICLEVLKDPAALPCGHVFCYECIVKLVRNVQPYVHDHFCPTCRQPYTITVANSVLVPHHLRHHVTPSIRRLCLDYSLPKPKVEADVVEPLAAECARLRAENASLKMCCDVWSKRARLHAGTTLGLIGLIRLSRGQAAEVKPNVDRNELEKKFESLKRSIEQVDEKVSHPPWGYSHRSSSYPGLVSEPSSFCPPSPPCSEDSTSLSDCEECRRASKRQRSETPERLATAEN